MKAGMVESELGSALNKVERLRRLANYTGETVTEEDPRWAVEQAGKLVNTVREHMLPNKSTSRPSAPRP
ncbi:unnamed protein product [Mycetohabitans rhizoxinica HKI 454]|uniref:HEPN domain-containing protein n=2 Tax=Burkholderiaceae TaxID=119060 RepID=E5AT88_MYCRK|nr:hypothetical protein [Mycetohabitans sp. B2]MCG1047687.1 hypothetical protein [Mycetohabitans sp. B6]CBW75762.1 unnamed protein product [Mycetohabitans rhizoxinica HKI 454]